MTQQERIKLQMNESKSMSWWQREDLCYQDGVLFFAGQSVADLVREVGTPGFVYSMGRVLQNLDRLHNALDDAGLDGRHSVLYAMKANRFAPLLAALKQSGKCGIDACSPREVEHAISCGFNANEISFTAGSLSRRDYRLLSRYEGLFFDADSIHGIRAWGEMFSGTQIGIRVNPGMGISRDGNERLQYAGDVTTKFGIYKEQFHEALAAAKDYGLDVTKIHFHTGCGFLTPQLPIWESIIEQCQWFIEQCDSVTRVNVGGGLGVPHVESDQALDLQLWAQALARQFGDKGLHVEIEPGDYLVKDAGLLLLEKTYLERKRDVMFLGVDAGFNIAPEPANYNLPFQPVPVFYQDQPLQTYHVVGNINEALDVWYENAQLPDMDEEDFLVLINAGGYSSSMASNHCMRGEFKERLLG